MFRLQLFTMHVHTFEFPRNLTPLVKSGKFRFNINIKYPFLVSVVCHETERNIASSKVNSSLYTRRVILRDCLMYVRIFLIYEYFLDMAQLQSYYFICPTISVCILFNVAFRLLLRGIKMAFMLVSERESEGSGFKTQKVIVQVYLVMTFIQSLMNQKMAM